MAAALERYKGEGGWQVARQELQQRYELSEGVTLTDADVVYLRRIQLCLL